MSAITRVLDALRRPGRSQIVAVGHLYNDTFTSLRLAPRPADEAPNVLLGVDELDRLDGAVGEQTAAILTETITNPLSDVPDLELLSWVARAHGVPLVVDNTIATPENCRPFELGADFVIHSTTKYLNGRNDHAGGAIIVRDEQSARLLSDCQALLKDAMSPLEAEALERNLGSLSDRMRRFNENALRVASFLAGHQGVQRVFFNGLQSHRSHATARRLLRGPGSVISFVLARNSSEGLRAFYDSPLSGIIKAPSLGSDMTLLCPYTLLTHYDDTDEELAEIGLPRYLVRISVGCEADITPVLESLEEALQWQAK
jgi:cystathionine beta-lyase/cystathionine gamma-synthase